MSVESILEKIKDKGFRVHQVYERGPWGPKAPKTTGTYWDVCLTHMTTVWDYFMGQGDTLEDALRDAYRKGKVKVEHIKGLTGKERLEAASPRAQLKKHIEEQRSKSSSKKRVRLG
jgi:hypothetical protein